MPRINRLGSVIFSHSYMHPKRRCKGRTYYNAIALQLVGPSCTAILPWDRLNHEIQEVLLGTVLKIVEAMVLLDVRAIYAGLKNVSRRKLEAV